MAKDPVPTKSATLVVEMAIPADQTVNPFEQVLESIKPSIGTGNLANVTNIYLGMDAVADKTIAAAKDVT